MATRRSVMVRVTPDMVTKAMAETDWAAIDAMTDEDIAAQIAANPDAAPILTDEEWQAAHVQTIRRRLNLTQADFARRLRIPLGTVRDWEQARRQPDAPARALLRVLEREPEATLRALAR
jgi:putative transcriptional regulator